MSRPTPRVSPPPNGIRIEVPDAARGFMLVQRLGSHCVLTGSETEGWIVAGSTDRNLTRMLTAIQEWLEEETIDHVRVQVGEHSHNMTRV